MPRRRVRRRRCSCDRDGRGGCGGGWRSGRGECPVAARRCHRSTRASARLELCAHLTPALWTVLGLVARSQCVLSVPSQGSTLGATSARSLTVIAASRAHRAPTWALCRVETSVRCRARIVEVDVCTTTTVDLVSNTVQLYALPRRSVATLLPREPRAEARDPGIGRVPAARRARASACETESE